MRARHFHNCLQSLQGKSPLAVSHGYTPPPADWADVIALTIGTAAILFLMVMA